MGYKAEKVSEEMTERIFFMVRDLEDKGLTVPLTPQMRSDIAYGIRDLKSVLV